MRGREEEEVEEREKGGRRQREREKKEEEEKEEAGEEAVADVVYMSDKTLGKKRVVRRSTRALDPSLGRIVLASPGWVNVVLSLKITQLLKRTLGFSEV